MDIKVGDIVQTINDDCEYRISKLPKCYGRYPDHYEGIDPVDEKIGLIDPKEVIKVNGIPVKAKTSAPEWDGKGLPPVGCECEGDADTRPGGYEPCIVVWHDETASEFEHSTLALFLHKGSGKFVEPEWCSDFRPIRTKEQRETDELADLIQNECENHFPSKTRWIDIAEAIIAAGYRKEQDK